MAKKGRIGTVIAVDGETEFKKSIKSINDDLGVLGSELKKVDAEFGKNEKSMDAARSKLDVYRRQLEQLTQKEKLQTQALQNAQQRYADAGNKVRELKDKLSAAEKAMDEMKNSSNATSAEIKEQRDAIKDLETDLKKAEKQYAAAEKSTKDWKKALNNTQADIATTRQNMENLAISTVKMRESLETAENRLEKWQSKLNTVGNTLTMGLTVPMVGAATTMIAAMDDVDAGLDTVIKKTGATGESAEALKSVYENVAQDIPAEFGDIGAAVGELNTRLGFTGDTLEKSSEQFLKFAEVNDADVNTSVQLVTRAMGDAGIAAENYGQVLDQLTVASQVSGISVDKLAENLAKYGAPLRALGIDTEYAIAMFAGWEKAGVNTEIAFSGMRKAISNWSSAGKDAKVEFQAVMDQIKAAPDIASATTLAIEAFGTKAGPDLADAIRGGRFEVDEYVKALEHAGGAVDNTYGAIVDEVDDAQLAMQRIKVAMHDTGEAIAKNLGPTFLDLADRLKTSLEWFGKLDKETQQTILKLAAAAAAIGPVTKGLSGMTGAAKSAVGGVKKLVTELGKQTAAKKAAGGFKEVASAATSVAGSTKGAGSTVGGFSKILTKIASPTGAAVVAAGAIAAIGTAAWKAHEEMVKADIADHFGDIKLAAEEVEDVATRLTTTDWTVRLNTYMDAKEQLGAYQENIESAIAEMNKLDWKVSVGLELTDDEKRAYAESLDAFAQNCQQYIEEKGYVINLAISAGFETGSPTGESLAAWADAYYASASDEVAELKQRLDALMEESLINGTWDENEEKMDELRQKISSVYNKIVADVSSAEYEGVISDFRVTIGNIDMGDLTQESFNQVNEQIAEYTQQLQDYADENKQDVMLAITTRYSDNIRAGMPEETARKIMEDSIQELEMNLSQQKGEVIVQGIDFSFDAIKENFSYRVSEAEADLDEDFEEIKNHFLKNFDKVNPKQLIYTSFAHNAGADQAIRKSVKKAMESLEPQKEQLEKIAQSYLDAGKAVPQNIVKGLTDVYQMSALSGSTDDLYKLWAKEIADSPERMEALAEAQKSGKAIPEGVIEAVSMYSGKIYNAVTGMWEEPVQATREHIQPILDYLNKSGLDCGNEAAKGLAASYGLIYDAASKTWIAVSDATLDSKEEIIYLFKECGLEIPSALISSIQSQNEPTKQQMLLLLQQLIAATDEQREPILLKLAELGVDVSGSLAEGMMSNYNFVESSTEGMIDVIDKTSGEKIATLKQPMADRLLDVVGGAIDYTNNHISQSGPQLYPPAIKEFDPTKLDSWADKTMWALQRSLEGHGILTVPVKTVASPGDRPIAGYANGGKITEEGLYWGAEGDKAEWVIPTDPAKRQRALALYEQTGRELGVVPESVYTVPQSAPQHKRDAIDYTKLAKALAAELRKTPVQVDVPISVQEGGVYLDNELVGRQQAPVISRIQAKKL